MITGESIPCLEDLTEMASRAGEILRRGYGSHHEINHKGRADLVTEVDHQSEALLIDEIRRRFPGHQILAEESGQLEGQADHLWYIDPLDGTVNYAHGVPVFCVSLAYAYRGKVMLGVVYDPLRQEMFSAGRGQGAWLNGQPIQVSTASELVDSLLATGFPYDILETRHNNLGFYGHFTLASQGVRRLGSAALDLCYVAAGRFDGYWETQIALWDIAAGALIASEAGALVTDRSGSPELLKTPATILAANPLLHRKMLEVIRPADPM